MFLLKFRGDSDWVEQLHSKVLPKNISQSFKCAESKASKTPYSANTFTKQMQNCI